MYANSNCWNYSTTTVHSIFKNYKLEIIYKTKVRLR